MVRPSRSKEEWQLRFSYDAHRFVFSDAVKTKDEHDLEHPVKSFPDLEYLRVILDCLLVSGHIIIPDKANYAKEHIPQQQLDDMYVSGMLFIEKSRQLMATWIVCAYLLWRAKYREHQLILVQSKREDDADNLVYNKDPSVGRISFMEHNLPQEAKDLEFPSNAITGKLFFPNHSLIWAIPEGGHIIRSNTASVIFADEAAFQPEFGQAYTAAIPAVHGGGQLICVSSAEPGTFQALAESQ